MTKTPIEALLLQYGNLIEKILTDRGACRGSSLSNAYKNAVDRDVFAHALLAALLGSHARAVPTSQSIRKQAMNDIYPKVKAAIDQARDVFAGVKDGTEALDYLVEVLKTASATPPVAAPMAIESKSLEEFIDAFQEALIPLPKCVADSFNHCLLSLLESARLEFTNSGHVVAGGASRGGVVLRIFGASELLAAALAAA